MQSFTRSLVLVLAALALVVTACSTPDVLGGSDDTASPSQTASDDTVSLDATRPSGTAPFTGDAPQRQAPLSLVLVEVGHGFDAPVFLTADPLGGADLVVEQSGRIVRNDSDHTVVLDLSDDVSYGGERGLLGMAFHPEFARNGLAYVNYTNDVGNTVIEEFTVDAGEFAVASRRLVLTVEQPDGNHNGGMITFGPAGYLWIGMGDGGGAGDEYDNGQDPFTLLGSMVRIDVDRKAGAPYQIPPDNPFVDGERGAPEVWAVGLRNPWRFAIDGSDLWIADVGQDAIEEIDRVDATVAQGLNFGWPTVEGSRCYRDDGCDAAPYVAPLVEYPHDEGCSITGGYVYRGRAIPELDGQYFFSDFCTGFLRSVTRDGTVTDWTESTGTIAQVASFGTGGDGELYVVSLEGTLYRLEAER